MARPGRGPRRDAFEASSAPVVTVVEQQAVTLHYDYARLPAAWRGQVEQSAIIIKPRLKRAAEDIFVIGRELSAVKEKFPHGEYGRWLEVEFGLSDRMAQRFMSVYARLGPKSDKLSVLPPSTLYLLAAKSTPDTAIATIEQRLDAGERLSVATVEAAIATAREAAEAQAREGQETPAGETTIEGQAVLEGAARAKAAALESLLAQTVAQLKGAPLREWKALFRDDELRQVHRELTALHKRLRARLKQDGG